jgi:hypothetical protein
MNNRTLTNQTKAIQIKQAESKESRTILTSNNRNWQQIWINTDSLNIPNWRLNHDCPMFARVKYLCDYELTVASLFAQIFVVSHQMTCCQFLCLSIGLVAFWKTIEPSSFVASRRVPSMRSKDILLQAKGDQLGLVHSVQIVLKMIRWGRLVQ